MNIFLTGGAGFIGSNFIHWQINNTKNKILNYDNLAYAGNLDNLKAFANHERYSFVKGDICSSDKLKHEIYQFRPNVIVNFAAESHVDRSIDNSIQFVQTNVVGTVTLLDVLLNYYRDIGKSQSKFVYIHISTDEVFGSLNDSGTFTEKSCYDPSSPYSASKASSDHFVNAWFKTYQFPSIITNCSNNYGAYQFPEKLIPLTIINCINNRALPIYGDGTNIRNWIHVEDHCNAIYQLILNGKIGESYCIGSHDEVSNIDLVMMICKILDKLHPNCSIKSYKELVKFVKDRPGHDFRYAIDSKKVMSDVNWEAKIDFEKGLENTIKWYLDNKTWWNKILKNKYNLKRLGTNW